MRPLHFLMSFAGHLVFLVLLALASTALQKQVGGPPDTIRISFGELPKALPGRELKREDAEVREITPVRDETPPVEEPIVEEEVPEKPAPRAEPEPSEAVKPVAELPPEQEREQPAPPVEKPKTPAGATQEAEPGESEAEPSDSQADAGAPQTSAGPSGASVQASGTAGVGDTYLGLVQSKIGRRWQPSAASTAGRPFLETIVSFRISSRGQVLEPAVFQSSGLSVFDREALRAVMNSNPLPPPPGRFRSGGLDIQFTFTFRR